MGSLRSAFVAFLGVFAVSAAAHAALELTVTANPDPAAPGETVNVQIHVSNSGASPIAAVSLELILPAEIDGFDEAYVSGGGSCDAGSFGNFCESGEAVVWSLGDLAAGSGLRVSLPPILASDIPDGTLVAFAASATGSGDAEASDSASVVVQSVSFLRLSLETDRDPAEAGSELTYRLRFGHVGTTRLAEGTLLELPLPAGASFVSATGGGTLAAGVVSWSLGTLFPSEGGVRELVVALDAGLDAGELLDARATIADTDTPPQQARAGAATRVGASRFAIAVEARPDPVARGETLNAEVTVTNTSPFPLVGVVLEMRLPDFVDTFDEDFASGDASCDSAGFGNFCDRRERIVWTLDELGAGQGVTVSIPPLVNTSGLVPPDAQPIRFDAHVRDGSGRNASASGSVEVQGESFLRLSLEADRDPAEAGSELTYRLRFGHVGTARLAEGALLELPLPAGASFVSATGGGTLAAGVVSWSLGTLFPSEGGVRELVVALDAGLDAGELLDAQATIADTDTPPQQARARAVTRVGSSPLAIAIAARPDPVASGETLHTEVTVANTSLFPLVGVVLEMRLPDFVDTFDEDYASGPASCDSVGFGNFCDRRERIVWTLGELGAGQVATLSIPPLVNTSGLVPPDAQPIRFDAHVRDGSGRSAAASDSAEVQGESFLRLALEADRDPAAAGETLTYTVTYGHTGTARLAENAVLELPLPAGASFVSATVGGALDGDVVRWALGTLGLGEFCSREVTVALDAGLDAGALIEAHASIADTDSPPQRARAQLVTPVGASALSVAVEARPDPGRRGEVLEARVILTNTRLFPLAGVALELRLPDYLDAFNENLATGDASCDLTGFGNFCERRERILWSFDTLAAGESVTVSIPPQVNATGLVPPDGQLIPFVAVATAGTSQAIGRDVAHVGNPAKACDGDMDGITDTHDNCLNAPNADQTDTDLDGYGNRCDPDFNDDGRVGIPDFNLFRSQFGNDDTSEEFDPEVDLTSDGAIGIPDFNILRALFGLPPGPSGLSCAGTVPCD